MPLGIYGLGGGHTHTHTYTHTHTLWWFRETRCALVTPGLKTRATVIKMYVESLRYYQYNSWGCTG